MDLNSIGAVTMPRNRSDLSGWRDGDAWLAGGTWLFSEPQPRLRRLVDLSSLGWKPHEASERGLSLAATCTIAELFRLDLPASWSAAPLFAQCCRALLGSFKIWNMATVGGNICLALPAAPMIALATALEGTCLVWTPDGAEREVAITDLVLASQCTSLAPGEILRRIDLPLAALKRRTAFRQVSLSPNGRSGALLIGTLDPSGAFALTITASTRRPLRQVFPTLPDAAVLADSITEAVPATLYHDDVHGTPDWRRHMTFTLAEEIRREFENESRA
ncbi:FAD binding domain-containing protein [Methylobacterium sp. 10]|uniref:FAD binding domain-containing protein n=1 Tax=Methylobacterium sp. 10 TaxID=1101191 RepID=UPI00048478AB|nr:FAD binding domain-containing protein [Methylobacterium sp. 10]